MVTRSDDGPIRHPSPRRRRLDPKARAQMILEGAVHFFAECGFEAQLRDLAKAVGVSQALIFTYFGSKQGLLEQVYEHVYTSRWDAAWLDCLADRSRPLMDRLIAFYSAYLDAIDDPIWIRIVLHSGLSGNELTRRYVSQRVEAQLHVVMEEVRNRFGSALCTMRDEDLYERVWDLQSSFTWYLVRKHIWCLHVMEDRDRFVQERIAHFLAAMEERVARDEAPDRKQRLSSRRRT